MLLHELQYSELLPVLYSGKTIIGPKNLSALLCADTLSATGQPLFQAPYPKASLSA